MTIESTIRINRNPLENFSLQEFGVECENPFIRAIDWKSNGIDDQKIFENLISHVLNGPLTRKERYGEFLGRLMSGMFRQKQSILHGRTPNDMKLYNPDSEFGDDPKKNWKKLFDWFSQTYYRKGIQKVFILIDSPEIIFYPHKDRHITAIEQKIPVNQRKIKAIFLRKDLISQKLYNQIMIFSEANHIKTININEL